MDTFSELIEKVNKVQSVPVNLEESYVKMYKFLNQSNNIDLLTPGIWDDILSDDCFSEIDKFWDKFMEIFILQFISKPTNQYSKMIINIINTMIISNKNDVENNFDLFCKLNETVGLFNISYNDLISNSVYLGQDTPDFETILENNVKDSKKNIENCNKLLKLETLSEEIKSDIMKLIETNQGIFEFIFAVDIIPMSIEQTKMLF